MQRLKKSQMVKLLSTALYDPKFQFVTDGHVVLRGRICDPDMLSHGALVSNIKRSDVRPVSGLALRNFRSVLPRVRPTAYHRTGVLLEGDQVKLLRLYVSDKGDLAAFDEKRLSIFSEWEVQTMYGNGPRSVFYNAETRRDMDFAIMPCLIGSDRLSIETESALLALAKPIQDRQAAEKLIAETETVTA